MKEDIEEVNAEVSQQSSLVLFWGYGAAQTTGNLSLRELEGKGLIAKKISWLRTASLDLFEIALQTTD